MAEGQGIETKGTNPVSGGVINSIVGTGLGLATAGYNDRRQVKMNAKIQKQQIEGAKEMARYNQGMALDMWEKTGYEAQRKQMEKAGLNVGLMYGGAGSGGTTQGAAAQMPSSSSAPQGGGEIGMGLGMAMQMAMMQAQIENTKAQTEKTKAETPKAAVEIENTQQQTVNARIDEIIKRQEARLQEIRANVAGETEADQLEAIRNANDITEQQIRAARAGADVAEGTRDTQIEMGNMAAKEQQLRIKAQQAGLIKTGADTKAVETGIRKMLTEINNMIQGNQREWDKMSQTDREIAIRQAIQRMGERQTDFNTSMPAQMKQWTDILRDIVNAVK